MSKNIFHTTPTFQSHFHKKENNLNVYYKMDCFQPSSSFKIRGMEELVKHHIADGKTYFVASSGGNAGYSLAYVGMKLSVKVKVVVPETTSQFMIDKIRQLDAEVEIHGEVWDEAHQHALQLADDSAAVYVSPFDDPLLWKGHSSIIEECAMQMDQPDKLIVSVGGGGLLCGILEGLNTVGWKSTKIITTETNGTASFKASFEADKLVELDTINSIATSLAAKKVTSQALEMSKHFDVTPHIMSDEEAVKATENFLKEFNAMVEPACGAALSVPYFHPEMFSENEKILVIVCGGANTNFSS
jgi:L-serine/L-threonine ammonia-lyase